MFSFSFFFFFFFYLFTFFFLLFFSSPALFESPRRDRIYWVCTVRGSRKGMPQAVKSVRLRNRGFGFIMQKGNRIAMECVCVRVCVCGGGGGGGEGAGLDWTFSTNFFA